MHLRNSHTENAILNFSVKGFGGEGTEMYVGLDEVGRREAHHGIDSFVRTGKDLSWYTCSVCP